jgi:hypothetical protein
MTQSRNPWSEEEESWWDVLGAVFDPLGEVALYVAICIIGGGLIVASRRTPIIPLAVAVVAVIVSVYVASRHAYRAGYRRSRCWRLCSLPVLGHDLRLLDRGQRRAGRRATVGRRSL